MLSPYPISTSPERTHSWTKLGPGMENEVLRKLDVAEVVAIDCRWIRHLYSDVL